jgi:pimeloyl-ACP methyl ester carboxylesterase
MFGILSVSGQNRNAESTTQRKATERALDPELTNYQYPFPIQFYQADTQGQKLRMAYMDVAAAMPNGRTVVLLHGKNFSGAYWETTIKALVTAGYRVIAPDQIGFGKSSKPAAYQFSFHALAANTRALLDSLRVEKFVLVGHSMGGMLAVRMALMYPDRVERLALVNPIGLEDWKLVAPYRTVDENFAQELRATPEFIKEYQRVNYFGGVWKPEYDALTEILAGWTRHPEYRRVAWNAALTSDMIFTQPVLYEFDRLKSPTLLIIGQRDRTAIGKDRVQKEVAARMGDYPALGKAAARLIPDARLVEIPEAGHIPQVDSFQKYSQALLDFIASR